MHWVNVHEMNSLQGEALCPPGRHQAVFTSAVAAGVRGQRLLCCLGFAGSAVLSFP